VNVPAENLVGEENKGWSYAKFLLVNERSGIANTARSKRALERLKEFVRAEPVDEDFLRKVAEVEIDLAVLEFTELRTLAAEAKGETAGPKARS